MTSNNPIMQFFEQESATFKLEPTLSGFEDLAKTIVKETDPSAEQTAALRKLLEAKDAAVRAKLLTRPRDGK